MKYNWQPFDTYIKNDNFFLAYSSEFVDEDFNPSGVVYARWDALANDEKGAYIVNYWDSCADIWNEICVSENQLEFWQPLEPPTPSQTLTEIMQRADKITSESILGEHSEP